MKLIIQNGRIAGTATDDYSGADACIDAPEGFDVSRMGEYRHADGVLTLLVPQAVTMRQARLALLAAGKLAAVNSAIAGMPGAQGEAARIEWEFSSEVQRNQPLVLSLGGALNMTPAQLDGLFVAAAAL